eukprot:gnl/TRDRNA2_/TRDRNA2_166260_c0_seq2.p1 gnl/TRDRNA2_/TRDRNA2_166260_c0~~gnl/TRDRNA2_/TRDRNA2_166260_c0_seq2.p1  ORF type:complete len:525 (+),score=37.28 gnl/TRDRNA2_/TRDRNA2_166260_c0_seq2:57-1631(+)
MLLVALLFYINVHSAALRLVLPEKSELNLTLRHNIRANRISSLQQINSFNGVTGHFRQKAVCNEHGTTNCCLRVASTTGSSTAQWGPITVDSCSLSDNEWETQSCQVVTSEGTWCEIKLLKGGGVGPGCLVWNKADGKFDISDCASASEDGAINNAQKFRFGDAESTGPWSDVQLRNLDEGYSPCLAADLNGASQVGDLPIGESAFHASTSCSNALSSPPHLWSFGGLAAGVSNDPVVSNALGHTFELAVVGGVTLLQMPCGANVSRAAVRLACTIAEVDSGESPKKVAATAAKVLPHTAEKVQFKEASARPRQSDCPATYVVSLAITGQLFGKLTSMAFYAATETTPFSLVLADTARFVAGNNMTSSSIAAYLTHLGAAANVLIAVNHVLFEPNFTRTDFVMAEHAESDQMPPKVVEVRLGAFQITIKQPHRGRFPWQWLNLKVSGVDTLPFEDEDICGVLGFGHASNTSDAIASEDHNYTRTCALQKKRNRITFTSMNPGASCADRCARLVSEAEIISGNPE